MVYDVLTLAVGIATGLLLYDVVSSLVELLFGQRPDDGNDDDKGAYGW